MSGASRQTDDTGAKAPAAKAPSRKKGVPAPRTEEVRAFLAANPQYLTDHPEVLAEVAPKARRMGGNISDMQAFLIERLRNENRRLVERHDALLATTRTNATSQARIHAAALALLEARSFSALIEKITTDLALSLGVDVVTLAVENPGTLNKAAVSGIRLLAPGEVDRLIGEGRDSLLQSDVRGRKRLYGECAGLVASQALLRLAASPETPPGILALASRDPTHFEATQGTELLGFLARVLELCIRTWLNLPRR